MTDLDTSADAGERPTPPDDLEDSVATVLEDLANRDPKQLPAVAAYAEDLAVWLESRDGSAAADADADADGDEYPDGVPERATVTVTEIGDTEYQYYQWREDDEIRSKTVEL